LTIESESRALEALDAAIGRASGVLGTVGDLYSPTDERFHGGNSFTAHAVTTAHGLLIEAGAAISVLYEALAARAETEAQNTAMHVVVADPAEVHAPVTAAPIVASPHTVDGVQPLAPSPSAPEADVLRWPAAAPAGPVPIAEHNAQNGAGFAQSYEELLRKITAVEVLATQQGYDAESESHREMLPLVQSLKEELLRLRRVA
jgi:hypothetical protein